MRKIIVDYDLLWPGMLRTKWQVRTHAVKISSAGRNIRVYRDRLVKRGRLVQLRPLLEVNACSTGISGHLKEWQGVAVRWMDRY